MIYWSMTDPSTHKHNADLGGVLADLCGIPGCLCGVFCGFSETDESQPLARITGMKGVYKVCSTHTIESEGGFCRWYAEKAGKKYQELNLVVAHIGGGVSRPTEKAGSWIPPPESERPAR